MFFVGDVVGAVSSDPAFDEFPVTGLW